MAQQTIRVVDIIDGTTVDGVGLRTSIYLAGCRHQCLGCHNPSTWDFNVGYDMTVEEVLQHIDENQFNVTLSGGDPLYQAAALIPLVSELKSRGYTVWCYTGFTYEELCQSTDCAIKELLPLLDVLVDGPFVQSLRDTTLRFRGSSNQRLIDIQKTIRDSEIVLL